MTQLTNILPARRPQGARQLCWISIARISPNPYQPRRTFSDDSIAKLADSIQQYGLLSPVVVRRIGMSEYELIAGERRLMALKKLGRTHVDAIVRPALERESALLALIENLQREDLHFFDEALAYQALVGEHGMTQEELARRLSRNPSTIANRLRLLRLPGAIRDRIIEASLTERHARALLRLSDESLQMRAAEAAIDRKLNVRQLEGMIDKWIHDGKDADRPAARRSFRLYCRDHRMLVNALMDTVRVLQQTDNGVTSRVIDKADCVEVVICVPRGVSAARDVRGGAN